MRVLSIYSDKDGLLRACTEPVPVEPKACSEQTIEHYKAYQSALQHCKDSSVPFTSQEDIKDYMWRHDQRINGPIPILYWWENMMKKDTFYPCEVEVEIITKEYSHSYSDGATTTHASAFQKLARLYPVAPEPSLEKPESQTKLWTDIVCLIKRTDVTALQKLEYLESQFTITRKKENN